MSVDERLSASEWVGTVYWQGDAGPFRHDSLVSTAPNRWNGPGEPTIYLAGDVGIVLIELGRHLPKRPDVEATRVVWAAEVRASGIVDARSLGDPSAEDGDGSWVLEQERCRTMARALRVREGVEGMVVPSAGCVDDQERWNVVLFADRMTMPLESMVSEARPIGGVEIGSTPTWISRR